MSTFLIGLVVVAATVFVIRVALSDPDQPATIRRPTDRDRPRRRPRPRRLASRPTAATPLDRPHRPGPPPDRPLRRARRKPSRAWVRLRSGLALLVLVTFVGVLMAVTTGAGLALAARALRHAVG